MPGKDTGKKTTKPKSDTEARFRKKLIKLLIDIDSKLEYLCADRRRNLGG